MNNELIEKVIKLDNSNTCPEFAYKNPLIDRNVANAVAKSFVKMLKQDSNPNINLRHSVLANIRKICRIEPENHIDHDEIFTESLSEVYMNTIKVAQNTQEKDATQSVERRLNEFLMRNMKDIDISSNYQYPNNPEVVQALINLNRNHSKLTSIVKDVLHWNVSDNKSLNLVKDIWSSSSLCDNSPKKIGDISIKNKVHIEIFLLDICFSLLTDINIKTEELLAKRNLKDLLKKCSISEDCFQICFKILNSLFVHTNYNSDIQFFITQFISNVKEQCMYTISVLYPVHLRHVVVLLDFKLECLPTHLKNKYIENTVKYLKKLHEHSDLDLVLLLSHYSHWFDIYFNDKTLIEKT